MRLFDFKDKDKLPASVVALVSVATMAFTLLAMLTVPKPTTKGMEARQQKEEFKIKLATKSIQDRLASLKANKGSMVWTEPLSEIGPKALDTVSALVNKHKLRLVALRPQRSEVVEGMTEIPMLVTVEGPFPSVNGFLRDLEATDSKLAVTLVQLSSLDGSTDSVSMTASCTAFALEVNDSKGAAKR